MFSAYFAPNSEFSRSLFSPCEMDFFVFGMKFEFFRQLLSSAGKLPGFRIDLYTLAFLDVERGLDLEAGLEAG